MNPISFPGLGISNLKIDPNVFTIGSYSVKWYGVLIAVGMLLALIYGLKRAKDFQVSVDDLTDVVIFSLVFGVIGARAYYVIFDPEKAINYANFWDIFKIWTGGLAIYGGIIAAFITAFIVCRLKKISVGAIFDIAALGFLIGQAIGRWGNFVNQEAYGKQTSLPWGMKIFDYESLTFITVHPCFLYESLWCVLGFVLLHIYSKRMKKFNGELFLLYVMWYGFGRFFIEGLRTDSLLLGQTIRVSQVVAALTFIVALVLFIYKHQKLRQAVLEPTYSSVYAEAAQAVSEEEAYLTAKQHSDDIDEDEEDDDTDEDEYEEDDEEEFVDEEAYDELVEGEVGVTAGEADDENQEDDKDK